jgi:hypothetical protein
MVRDRSAPQRAQNRVLVSSNGTFQQGANNLSQCRDGDSSPRRISELRKDAGVILPERLGSLSLMIRVK